MDEQKICMENNNVEFCNKSGKILVLGDDTRSYLSVIRSLGRNGIDVHVAVASKVDPALYSKYVKKIHPVSPIYCTAQWKSDIIKIMENEHFDLVIPTKDIYLIPMQKYKTEFQAYGKLYSLSDDAFEATNNKLNTYRIAESLEVNVPFYRLVNNKDEIYNILKDIRFPIVIKPIQSTTLSNLQAKNVVKIVYSREDFLKTIDILLSSSPVLLQEYFNGVGVGLEVLANEGKILVAFQHMRVHSSMWSGSSYRKSTPINNELLQAATKILEHLKYTGVAMFEFRMNLEKGTWGLIEINGRFWGSLPLAIASGVDFPYFLTQMLNSKEYSFPQNYKVGLYCRNTRNDLIWLLGALKRSECNPRRKFLFLLRTGREFVINVLTLKENNDTFVLDDFKPAFIEIRMMIDELITKCSTILKIKLYKNYFIRKVRFLRLRRKIFSAKKILFVCKGNICRSPFAQHYATKIFTNNTQFYSLGTYPLSGRSCPDDAIEVGKKYGIDLSGHQSMIVNEEMLNAADIILIFDNDNLKSLMRLYPSIIKKTWYFAEINVNNKTLAIHDPYRGNKAEFEAVYARIVDTLDILKKNPCFNQGSTPPPFIFQLLSEN